MNDELQEIRTDLEREASESSIAPRAGSDLTPKQLASLLEFLRDEEPSVALMAILDELARQSVVQGAPAGRAAVSAARPRSSDPVSVAEAFLAPSGRVRSAIESALGLNRDAADLLLDRPAAALVRYPPGAVAVAAAACETPLGELFGAVADSTRSSGGFVYPYRPGERKAEPAARIDVGDSMDELVAWGEELLRLTT